MSIFKGTITVNNVPPGFHNTLTGAITLVTKWHEFGTGVSVLCPNGTFYESPRCTKPFTICPCNNAQWLRQAMKKEQAMAVVSPEEYAKAFNTKREEVASLTDDDLNKRILELELLIRELNLETRAALVEKNERADKRRETVRLLDTEYKVLHRETTETKIPKVPRAVAQSKEEKMIAKLINLGMTPEKARKMASGDDEE